MENEKLVYYCYEKLIKTDIVLNNKDDLIQEGFIALLNAEKTYDSNVGVKFSNYAILCIKNSMKNYINKLKKHNATMSIETYITEDIKLADIIESKFNLENEFETKFNINQILKSNKLTNIELNIIKSFLSGDSRSKIKKQYNINNSYLYTLFLKLNDILND